MKFISISKEGVTFHGIAAKVVNKIMKHMPVVFMGSGCYWLLKGRVDFAILNSSLAIFWMKVSK